MADFKLSPPGMDTRALAQAQADSMARENKAKSPNGKDVGQAAQDFEAVFISQMLSHMWQGVETDENFGGGQAEETWRGMMVEEYGKQIARTGGLGLADELKQAMLRMQEQADDKGTP